MMTYYHKPFAFALAILAAILCGCGNRSGQAAAGTKAPAIQYGNVATDPRIPADRRAAIQTAIDQQQQSIRQMAEKAHQSGK